MPALNDAERDRLEQRLSIEEETAVIDATRELLSDAADSIRRLDPDPTAGSEHLPLPGPREALRVLGYAANGMADEVALAMLARVVDDLPIAVEIAGTRLQASELISLVRDRGFSVVCIADLPPSPSSKTRYLVKRLRAALPEVRVVVGRWAPVALADDSTQVLRDTGANLVTSTLLESRTYQAGLAEIPRIPLPATTTWRRRSRSDDSTPRLCSADVSLWHSPVDARDLVAAASRVTGSSAECERVAIVFRMRAL
jgi:hypothetical protein